MKDTRTKKCSVHKIGRSENAEALHFASACSKRKSAIFDKTQWFELSASFIDYVTLRSVNMVAELVHPFSTTLRDACNHEWVVRAPTRKVNHR